MGPLVENWSRVTCSGFHLISTMGGLRCRPVLYLSPFTSAAELIIDPTFIGTLRKPRDSKIKGVRPYQALNKHHRSLAF